MTTLATDDFNRADGAIGANWTANPGGAAPVIVSNKAEDNAGGDSGAVYSAVVFPNDQWAQVVRTGGDGGGVQLRGSTAAYTFYLINIEGAFGASATLLFARFSAGSFTSISSQTVTFNSGDTLYAEVQGTTLLAKKNGAALGSSTTDANIGSGKAGLFGFSNYIADDFAAGDFAAAGGTTRGTPFGHRGTAFGGGRLLHGIMNRQAIAPARMAA